MRIRLLLTLVFVTQTFCAVALASRPQIDKRVPDGGGMCWVPDVEFPVPCDDDDDD